MNYIKQVIYNLFPSLQIFDLNPDAKQTKNIHNPTKTFYQMGQQTYYIYSKQNLFYYNEGLLAFASRCTYLSYVFQYEILMNIKLIVTKWTFGD